MRLKAVAIRSTAAPGDPFGVVGVGGGQDLRDVA
jgi:hypothetical protein